MFRPGHYGVALTLYAPFGCWLLSLGYPTVAFAGGAGVLWLTMLPDWDSHVPGMTHRGATHTLLFVALVGAVAWTAANAAGFGTRPAGPVDFQSFATGVAVLAVVSHLTADLLTPMGVALFWPLTDRRFTVSVATSDNRLVNVLLLALGLVASAAGAYLGAKYFATDAATIFGAPGLLWA